MENRDPIDVFETWLGKAWAAQIKNANAATLATVTSDGRPRSRTVLIKGVARDGFRFYTNYESDKALELAQNRHGSLCVYWAALDRQVRIEGVVSRLSNAESDAYWATRPRGSQLGAWASDQSRPVASRQVMDARLDEITARFADGPVPRPAHWGGYRLEAERIELWQGREDRFHDRWCFERKENQWAMTRLQP